jgi:hypothetical protein
VDRADPLPRAQRAPRGTRPVAPRSTPLISPCR